MAKVLNAIVPPGLRTRELGEGAHAVREVEDRECASHSVERTVVERQRFCVHQLHPNVTQSGAVDRSSEHVEHLLADIDADDRTARTDRGRRRNQTCALARRDVENTITFADTCCDHEALTEVRENGTIWLYDDDRTSYIRAVADFASSVTTVEMASLPCPAPSPLGLVFNARRIRLISIHEGRQQEAVVNDDAKSATARGYDVLSSSYNQIVPFFTYFGERLVVAAGIGEGDRVLDVATGQGACLIPAAAAVGPSGAVVGIDISEQMLDVLARSIGGAGLRHVRVQLMDAEALTFDDGSFDAVTCAFAVFHFPDRVRALAGFARVLKPGGTIAFSTFANDSLGYPWFGDVVADFLPDDAEAADAARQYLHIDTDEFHDQLRSVGFESPTSEIVECAVPFRVGR